MPSVEGPDPARPPSKFYVRSISPDGRAMTAINDRNAEPALPADNDVGSDPTTLPSVNGSNIEWRAVSVHGPQGGLTTVAIDLSDVQHTVRSLVWLQIGIGAGVLVVVGLAGFAVVQRSLRPLSEVEQTAAAIASGQLDRRVPERDPRTEVGQLSLAMNGMLSQIQVALAASEDSAEKARSSEERMRRFITDASHELRTPLTTIRGFAELYRQGAARDVAMLLSRIESEASRMGLLVDDLLTLARLDVQRPLERNRVDLLVLAADAVHDARAIDRKRAITVEVLEGPGTPEVLATSPGCARCSATSSATRCSTRPTAPTSPCGSARLARTRSWKWPTKVPGCPRRTRPGYSSGSTGPTLRAPAPVVGPGLVCRSSTPW